MTDLDEAMRRAEEAFDAKLIDLCDMSDTNVSASVLDVTGLCLEAALASLAASGFVLVPREATQEMEEAGWIDKEDVCPCDIWAAMLAAAPKPGDGT